MKYQVHIGEDGFFQELARSKDVDFGQLSILGVNPGQVRGGHYHTRKREWFCPIKGSGFLYLFNKNTEEKRIITLDGFKDKQFYVVEPFEVHAVVNPDRMVDLEVLIIISEPFNDLDSDTYKWEIEISPLDI